jgi:hypothetical protein
MIELKAKLWRGVGMAALAAGAVGLAACTPPGDAKSEGGESAASGEAGESAGGEGGEAAIGESGGEAGEAGAATAYAGLDAAAKTQLRLAHLKGFLLVAQQELAAGRGPEAGALIGQGVLEVYKAAPAEFGGLDIAPLEGSGATLMDGKASGKAELEAGLAAIAAKQAPAGDAETVRRMLSITNGLYAVVNVDGGVDPIEYQHSLGAALSARDAFNRAEPALKLKNAARTAEARAELDKLVALWPGSQAPEKPAPAAQVAAQISRVELALSGL